MKCLAELEEQWLPGTPSDADSRLQTLLAQGGELEVSDQLKTIVRSGLLEMPAIGCGDSASRLRLFARIGAADLSLARLAEGHADALSILSQAGESAAEGMYGVWVAGEPPLIDDLREPTLSGERPYCSGAGIIDKALVTGVVDGAVHLLEIDSRRPEVIIVPGTWPAVGMSATASSTVRFEHCPALRRIGAPGFYRERNGFWQGSLNVAACWYGGALGLAITYLSCTPESALSAVAVAQLDGALRTMVMHLDSAAEASDHPASAHNPELLALRSRHAIYEGCRAVLDVAAEAGGTNLATHNRNQARRLADLPVYLRQHHPARDAQRLGELLNPVGMP